MCTMPLHAYNGICVTVLKPHPIHQYNLVVATFVRKHTKKVVSGNLGLFSHRGPLKIFIDTLITLNEVAPVQAGRAVLRLFGALRIIIALGSVYHFPYATLLYIIFANPASASLIKLFCVGSGNICFMHFLNRVFKAMTSLINLLSLFSFNSSVYATCS